MTPDGECMFESAASVLPGWAVICLGRGPVVQKGIWQFGFGSAVCWIRLLEIVVPCTAHTDGKANLKRELESNT